jgi:hypothetical protein
MNAERRPRKVPSYRGEGLQLQLSGSALVLVAVAGVLGAFVIFGFESPLFYVVFAVAVGFGALALSRIYRGVVFTELESHPNFASNTDSNE